MAFSTQSVHHIHGCWICYEVARFEGWQAMISVVLLGKPGQKSLKRLVSIVASATKVLKCAFEVCRLKRKMSVLYWNSGGSRIGLLPMAPQPSESKRCQVIQKLLVTLFSRLWHMSVENHRPGQLATTKKKGIM